MKWFEDENLSLQLEEVRESLRENLTSGNRHIGETVDYLVKGGGKYLRPAFLLIGGRFGKKYKQKENELIKLAAAMESLHTATLIHDDIIDDSRLRRGKETIQSLYSKEYAVCMGDYMLSRTFLMLTELEIKKELAVRLAKVVGKVCMGEMRQSKMRYNTEITTMDYIRIISGKTAALFAISLSSGAYHAAASDKVVKQLAHLGYEIGMAFQLMDDLLDYNGNEKEVGKELKKDLLRGYYTLPVIYAMRESGELKEIIGEGVDEQNIERVIELVKSTSGVKKTRALAEKYHSRAVKLYKKLPEKNGKILLGELLPKLMERIS